MGSKSDRQRWDRKYAAGEGPTAFTPKRFLVEHHALLGGGRALDVACGFGGNAMYLTARGCRVDAVDVSGVALAEAKSEARRRGLAINFVQADLDRWWVPPDRYDLILVFFYLNRDLFPQLAAGLRPGGLLFQAHRNTELLSERPDFNPDYLVEPGELRRLAQAAGLEVLYSADRAPDEHHTSQLISRSSA